MKLTDIASKGLQAASPMWTKLMLALVFIAALAGSHFAVYLWAANKATMKAEAACTQARVDGLTAALDSVSNLTLAANKASTKLSTTISARLQADTNTTMEIRNALAASADNRLQCSFDDGVMQKLTAARNRAAAAAAGGLGSPVPAASPDPGRAR